MNYTYILRCSDDTLYCGWTNDLKKRLASHNAGKGAKYTHSRTPVTLVYYETFDTREEAMSREFAIKKLSRKEKLKLLEGFNVENYDRGIICGVTTNPSLNCKRRSCF